MATKSKPPTLRYKLVLQDGTTQTVWRTGDVLTWGDHGHYDVHLTDKDINAILRHVAFAMGGHLDSFEMEWCA